MKKLISIVLVMLFTSAVYASTVSVCGFASGGSPLVRIYDITSSTQTQNWTSTGVTERSVGLSKSCYYYPVSLTAGHTYQIDWEDAVSPTKVASEYLYELQTYVDASVSSRSTLTSPVTASVILYGTGNTSVNCNSGGTNNLKFTTAGGIPISGATIYFYLTSDYQSGNTSMSYIKAQTSTGNDGCPANIVYLQSGFNYTAVYQASGYQNATASFAL